MNIQTLTAYFLQRLNTAGKGKLPDSRNLIFDLGYLIKSSGTKYEHVSYTNYFTEVRDEYVPCMVTYVADPQNVPGVDATDWTLLFEFLLTGEKETDPRLLAEFNAIEEFRTTLVDNPIDIDSGYKLIMSPKPIVRNGNIQIKNGLDRLTVSMEVRLQSGIGITAGNDDKHELTISGAEKTTIFPLEFTIINGSQENTVPNLTVGGNLTSTRNQDTTVKYRYKVLYSKIPLMIEILKVLSGANSNSNTPVELDITFPSFPLNKTCVITGGTYSANGNDVKILNFELGIK